MHITVTKRDGSKEAFNANHINKSIERVIARCPYRNFEQRTK
ncbi:MAG: hypothetical protein KIS80_10105 [Anaerolineales bacterium]|nr:hypothetical protein [Anaerolineales bacterium]